MKMSISEECGGNCGISLEQYLFFCNIELQRNFTLLDPKSTCENYHLYHNKRNNIISTNKNVIQKLINKIVAPEVRKSLKFPRNLFNTVMSLNERSTFEVNEEVFVQMFRSQCWNVFKFSPRNCGGRLLLFPSISLSTTRKDLWGDIPPVGENLNRGQEPLPSFMISIVSSTLKLSSSVS